MAVKSYAEKLKDPRWQKKRLEIMERDDFACQNCKSRDKTLHVHHKFYLKGVDVWDYEDETYQTLCDECHEWITLQNQFITQILTTDLYTSAMKDTFLDMLRTINFGNFLFLIHYHRDWLDKIYEAFGTTPNFLIRDDLKLNMVEPEFK